ncbi:alpha/beta hydrolase [Paraburkholderia panacisoli]|uniref:Alpha/beta hydrolase n=1 Tax=Paraburkholderia panacisoli TaxID=2603818 RepID=A0A5B0GMK5_9BURK|nr:alpha/beta hydrolase [Paraburkholderia panacisoli]KAA1004055.1 alpha/beta hydrolase [Paraburkholderia panacisoli]
MVIKRIQYIETSSGQLAYRIDGSPDAEPLLLIQRFRGVIDEWDPEFIEKLAAHRRVIRFDSAGVGRSEGNAPTTVTETANIAFEFLDALKIDAADILGWSLGGYIGQAMALRSPERVRRLVIAGSGPGAITEGVKRHPRVNEIAPKETVDDEDYLFLFFADSETSRAAGRANLARIAADNDGPATPMLSVMNQLKAIVNWTNGGDAARPRLKELSMPILVANGVTDVMVPTYGSFVISQEAPNAKLVLYPDAGHGFLFQHIDEFTREVLAFLSA